MVGRGEGGARAIVPEMRAIRGWRDMLCTIRRMLMLRMAVSKVSVYASMRCKSSMSLVFNMSMLPRANITQDQGYTKAQAAKRLTFLWSSNSQMCFPMV